MLRTEAIVLALLALLLGCAQQSGRFEDTTRSKRDFYLARVEIDREAVKAGARLLFTGPAPNEVERIAAGSLLFSDSGYVLARVGVGEPAIGLDGRRAMHGYEVLDFRGRLDPDGERATATAATASMLVGEHADEIRLDVQSEDDVIVQAYREGRPQAYRFHFSRRGVPRTGAVFPWR